MKTFLEKVPRQKIHILNKNLKGENSGQAKTVEKSVSGNYAQGNYALGNYAQGNYAQGNYAQAEITPKRKLRPRKLLKE